MPKPNGRPPKDYPNWDGERGCWVDDAGKEQPSTLPATLQSEQQPQPQPMMEQPITITITIRYRPTRANRNGHRHTTPARVRDPMVSIAPSHSRLSIRRFMISPTNPLPFARHGF